MSRKKQNDDLPPVKQPDHDRRISPEIIKAIDAVHVDQPISDYLVKSGKNIKKGDMVVFLKARTVKQKHKQITSIKIADKAEIIEHRKTAAKVEIAKKHLNKQIKNKK